VAMSGLFVVFEGGDGVGKSTQTALLASWLADRGCEVVRTFEPGDTAVGRTIRRVVLSPETGDLSPRAEALLYAADKAHHVHEVINPALARGAVVICDRYVDSAIAYQGAGRVLDAAEVESIVVWATEGLRPHLTVLLDLDPADGVAHIERKDRLEDAGADFHSRARQGFLDLAARDAERYLVLPAREPIPVLAEAIRRRVAQLLKLSDADARVVP
jgi:dTMP kinase